MSRDGRKWPKPANFDALSAAYASGDAVRIAREEAAYNDQLRAEGFPPLYDALDVPDLTAPARSGQQ